MAFALCISTDAFSQCVSAGGFTQTQVCNLDVCPGSTSEEILRGEFYGYTHSPGVTLGAVELKFEIDPTTLSGAFVVTNVDRISIFIDGSPVYFSSMNPFQFIPFTASFSTIISGADIPVLHTYIVAYDFSAAAFTPDYIDCKLLSIQTSYVCQGTTYPGTINPVPEIDLSFFRKITNCTGQSGGAVIPLCNDDVCKFDISSVIPASPGFDYYHQRVCNAGIADESYVNHSAVTFTSPIGNFEKGGQYTVLLDPGDPLVYDRFFALYIDLDNDGIFEDDEISDISQGIPVTAAGGSFPICIPDKPASISGSARFRLRSKINAFGPGDGGSFPYVPGSLTGYSQDFMVTLNNSSFGALSLGLIGNGTPAPASISVCDGGALNFTAQLIGGNVTPFQYDFIDAVNGTILSTGTFATFNSFGDLNNGGGIADGTQIKCRISYQDLCGTIFSNETSVVSVTVLPYPSGNAYYDPFICYNGIFNLHAPSGGLGGTYSWSGPNGFVSIIQNPVINPVTSANNGIYMVTVSNSLGCSTTFNTTALNISPLAINVTGPLTDVCEADLYFLSESTTGGSTNPNHVTVWTLPDGTTNTIPFSPCSLGIAAGCCNLGANTTTCTVTDACGSSVTSSFTVNVNAIPTASTGGNQTVCAGVPVNLGSPPNAGHSYLWSPATNLSSATISNPVFNSLVAGTYTYSLTENGGVAGCTATNTVSITVNPIPTINISPASVSLCEGGSATLSATGASSYLWMPGSLSGTSISVSPVATTIYTLTGTSSAGCVNASTKIVTVNPLPAANAGANITICGGSTVIGGVSSVPGNTYLWSTGATTSWILVNPSTTTTYTLTETVTATGCSKSNTVTVSMSSVPGSPNFTCNTTNLLVSTPYTNCVGVGTGTNYAMMQIIIHMDGGCTGGPKKLQRFYFYGTTGNCAANFSNADLWYSGSSSNFMFANSISQTLGTISQVSTISCNAGAPSSFINGAGIIDLQPGDNYFWLTFKVPFGAINTNTIQATLTEIRITSGGGTCTSIGGATATRQIQASGCASLMRLSNAEDETNSEIESNETTINWIVYPNPFDRKLSLRFIPEKSNYAQADLFDLQGRIVLNQLVSDVKEYEEKTFEINTSDLAPGMYFLHFQSGDETIIKKVVKLE